VLNDGEELIDDDDDDDDDVESCVRALKNGGKCDRGFFVCRMYSRWKAII
jgi:hypothetical protein